MKRRLWLKISGLLLFVGTAVYIYKNWEVYHNKFKVELDDIDYSQVKLSVESVKTNFKNPIWIVKTENPVIAFRMKFKNEGNRAFSDSKGILSIVTACLDEGAGNRDSAEFKKIIQDNAISLNIYNNDDDIIVDVTCLKKYFELVTNLICDVFVKAHMKKEKIEIAKQGYVAELTQMKFTTQYLADEKLSNILYPEGHPYYFSTEENLKAVSNYTKADIDKAYSIIFNPNDAEITIAGSIDEKTLIDNFNKIHKSISQKQHQFADGSQKADLSKKGAHEHVELNNPQSTVVFALPGILRTAPEKFALRLAVTAFGVPGFNSRLLKNVRDKRGLVYRINARPKDLDLQNCILGTADARPQNIKKVIKAIKEECKEFFEKGITKEELDLFKLHTFANNVLDTTEAILHFVCMCRFDGMKVENINKYLNNFYKLDVEEINAAIKKVFNPDNLVIVDCGKSVDDTNDADIEKETDNEKSN
ncbi:MAG: insulinase family protein [Holosporales bacterium]|jgi:zinc protease|nr:insulinase family protein [Holosporales bacterium]